MDATKTELATAQADLDAAKAELATAQADLEKAEGQIAEAGAIWSSLKPKLELMLILTENLKTASGIVLYTYGHETVTIEEATIQVEDQWERISAVLDEIGNSDLAESLDYGWDTGFYGSWYKDTLSAKHHLEWNEVDRLLIDLVQPEIESLSEQIGQ